MKPPIKQAPESGRHEFARNAAEFGKQIDFGKTASDYGRFRAGYPGELYRRLERLGIGGAGHRVLDLATGTGFLGRGFARCGCRVTGVDIALGMMREAARLDREGGLAVTYARATAEALPFAQGSFDVVTAGQSWHWFDRSAAAAEARRVLRPGGWLVIAHFDWIALPGNVVEATERLIEKHNPKWKLGGGLGIHPLWPRDAAMAGFIEIETFSFDVMVPYTHEAWRGRIRASAGIAAVLTPGQVAAFDAELSDLLRERYPDDPMGVFHRTFAMVGRVPATV
ncbi:MAG: class I SAM-dependent methyltransferase [Candidatus Binataceae bacterium]